MQEHKLYSISEPKKRSSGRKTYSNPDVWCQSLYLNQITLVNYNYNNLTNIIPMQTEMFSCNLDIPLSVCMNSACDWDKMLSEYDMITILFHSLALK